MPKSLIIAAKSERRFLPKEKIVAFYHPPRSIEVEESLKDLLTIKKVQTITNPFAAKGNWYSFYGEKIQGAELNSPNLLYLDCDCLAVHDPSVVFDDDFDVAFMDATPWKKANVFPDKNYINKWNKMFEDRGKKPIQFFQTGTIFAKDNILKEIKDQFIEYMAEDLPAIEAFYPKNEYAFALCLSDKKVKYLGFDVVGEFEWRNKPFYSNIHEWENEQLPLIWHIGNKGLVVTEF